MSSPRPPQHDAEIEYDPVFLHSRREAIVIFFLWLTVMLWAVPFCYLTGYIDRIGSGEVGTILGIPTWLFWGIGIPWVLADLFTAWFCFVYMVDDDLGEAHEGADLQEEIAEMHADRGKGEAT